MNSLIYARFSPRPNAADSESIETQLTRCRAMCAAKAWTILSEHIDRELSGARADNRPGLQEALSAACEHKAVIVCYSLSRLARNTVDALSIIERLGKCGANLYSLHESIDTTSAMGKFAFTLFAALATLEREQIGERTSDAMQRHQDAGRRMGRLDRLPYGWRVVPDSPWAIQVDPDEMANVELIMSLSRLGADVPEIRKRLTAQGIMKRGLIDLSPMDGEKDCGLFVVKSKGTYLLFKLKG